VQLEERIVVGGHDVTEGVLERLQQMRALQVLEATRRIARAAKAGAERRVLRDENGNAAGEVKMMIEPASYHYWGQRLGYKCWSDKTFCREYLRDNEASRVKSKSDRPSILCGFEGANRRFRKRYEEPERKAA
jgi:hypothetical protein